MSEKLSELVKRGESEEVEFKKSTAQLDRALKSVCGFLNHKGGKVYFGINKGKIDGQEVSEQTLKSISQKIRQRIKPEISLEIKVLEIEDKKIIEVKIKEGDNKPYYLDGIAYKRVGTENVVVPPEELERIILEKRKRYFDSEICERAGLEDIDEEKVKWFLKVAKVGRDYPLDENISVRDALTHLELLKEGKLTNVAVVLFGKNPQKFFLQSEVKCLHFHGTEVEKPFETYHIYGNTLFDQMDNSLGFVLDRLRRYVIPEPGKSTTRRPYEIPEFVIREAIVNAVAHRDYYSNAGIQVMVFVDRIEIWNPGELPKQLKIEDLRKPHPSLPRNPVIANLLYLTKYIEKAGSGTIEMINQCKKENLPEPLFEQKMGSFVVTIWRDIYSEVYLNRFSLNERQKKAIKYVKEKGSISNKEYCNLLKVSRKTATTDLIDLVDKEIFSPFGTSKRVLRYEFKLRKNYAKITQKEE